MPCSSLQDVARAAVSRQLAAAAGTEPDSWAQGPDAALAQRASHYLPVEIKCSLLSEIVRQGALTECTLRALWTSDVAALTGELRVSGCCRVTAGIVARCIAEAGAADETASATDEGTAPVSPLQGKVHHAAVGADPTADVPRPLPAPKEADVSESGGCVAVRSLAQAATPGAGRDPLLPPQCSQPGPGPGPRGEAVQPPAAAQHPPPHGAALVRHPGAALRSLGLHGCFRTSDADMGQLLLYCTQLEALDVSACHRLGNQSVAAVGDLLARSLTSLDLSDCCQVSDLSPLQACGSLRVLRVSGCWRLAAGGQHGTAAAATHGHVAAEGAARGPYAAVLTAAEEPQPVRHHGHGAGGPMRQIPALLRCTPLLQELDVSAIPELGDEDLGPLWAAEGPSAPGAGAVRHGAGWPCSRTLTSLSLSSTSISSELPPRLAAVCPSLAHLRVSYCQQVAGCSVLAVARIRAAQILSTAAATRATAEAATSTAAGAGATVGPDSGGTAVAASAPITARTPEGPQVGGRLFAMRADDGGNPIRSLEASTAAFLGTVAPRELMGPGSGCGGEPLPFPCRFSGFRTLHAAGLTQWEEEPEAVLGEAVLGELVEQAVARVGELLLLLLPVPAVAGPGASGAPQRSGGKSAPLQLQRSGGAAVAGPNRGAVAVALNGRNGGEHGRATDGDGSVAAGQQGFAGWRPREAQDGQQHRGEPPAAAAPVPPLGAALPSSFPLFPESLGRAGMVEDLFDLEGPQGGGPSLEGLTSLDLSGTAQFSDMAAARLAACCTRLSYLSLAGCTRLSDEGLSHLGALSLLTSLDLTNSSPRPGAHRSRAPGSAFRRPAASLEGTASRTPSANCGNTLSGGDSKRPRRGGVTDHGLAVLLDELQSPPPPPALALEMPATQNQRAVVSLYLPCAARDAGVALPAVSGEGGGRGGEGVGLRSLRLGGTEAGEATLRSVATGLTRLELTGCRGASDLGVLQALERCPSLQVLKLSGCAQLSAAALGCSAIAPGLAPSPRPSHGPLPHTDWGAVGPPAGPSHGTACGGRAGLAAPVSAAGTQRWGGPPSNFRARSLTKVSLPGALSCDTALGWLLGTGTDSATPSAFASAAPKRFRLTGNALWALHSLELSSPPGAARGSAAGTCGITEALLLQLPSCCPLLAALRVRGAAAVTDRGTAAVLQGCRLLRRFALSGCPRVTGSTLALALRLAEAAEDVVDVEEAGAASAGADEARGTSGRNGQGPGFLRGPAAALPAWGPGRSGRTLPSEASLPRGSLLHLDLSGCAAVALDHCLMAGRWTSAADAQRPTSDLAPGQADSIQNTPPQPAGSAAAAASEGALQLGREHHPVHLPPAPPRPPPQLLLLSLDVEGCPQLRGLPLAALLGHCPHLRELGGLLDEVGLRAAAGSCPHLRTLKMAAAAGSAAATTAGPLSGQLRTWPQDLDVTLQVCETWRVRSCSGRLQQAAAPDVTARSDWGSAAAAAEAEAAPPQWSIREEAEAGQGYAAPSEGSIGGGSTDRQQMTHGSGAAVAFGMSAGGVWPALVRLEVPAALRRDEGLQGWAAARPWLQVLYG